MQSTACTLNTTNLAKSCTVCCVQTGAAPDVSYYALNNGTSALATLSSWIPTIALVIAAAIIIGIVFSSFIIGRKGE